MTLIIERETVKKAVMDYIVKTLIKEDEYEVKSAKTVITAGGNCKVTIDKKVVVDETEQ